MVAQTPSATHGRKFAWTILILAVIAMSTGGVWFALDDKSAPIMRSSWRLVLTAIMQIPMFVRSWRRASDEIISRWIQNMGLMALVGLSLALHFASWSFSINHTTLTNSLLLVTTTPLMLICLISLRFMMWKIRNALTPPEGKNQHPIASQNETGPDAVMREGISGWLYEILAIADKRSLPPTILETVGTAIGFTGVVVLILSSSGVTGGSDAQSSAKGDITALLGAATVVLYLSAGAYLRRWMPLFLYAFPVTIIAAVLTVLMSLLFEANLGASLWAFTPASALGFLRDWETFGLAFGSALVCGIIGHTGANFSLQHLPPLVISVAVLWEPLIGSFIGWIVGVQGPPGTITLLVAPLLLLGALLVTMGDRNAPLTFDKAFIQKLWRIVRCKRWKLHKQLEEVSAADKIPHEQGSMGDGTIATVDKSPDIAIVTVPDKCNETSNHHDREAAVVDGTQSSGTTPPTNITSSIEQTVDSPHIPYTHGTGLGNEDRDTASAPSTSLSIAHNGSSTPNDHVTILVPGVAGDASHLQNLRAFPWTQRPRSSDSASFFPSTGYSYSYSASPSPRTPIGPAAAPASNVPSAAPSAPTSRTHTPPPTVLLTNNTTHSERRRLVRQSGSHANLASHPSSRIHSHTPSRLSSRASSVNNLRGIKHSASGSLLSAQCSGASTPAYKQNPSLVFVPSTDTTATSTPTTIPKIASFVDMYSDPGDVAHTPNSTLDSDAFKRTSSLYSFPSNNSLDRSHGTPLRALDILVMKNTPASP